jgi:hypothetical protein
VGVGEARDAVDVGEVAGHVRRRRHRHQLHLVLAQLGLEVLVVERAVVLHAEVDDPTPAPVGQVVRVVLHERHEGDPPPVGHDMGGQVEGLGGVAAEDDGVAGPAPTDEAEDVVRDVLEAVRRHLGQGVPPAVDVGVRALEEVLVGVEHGRRRVGARPVVHVDDRPRIGLPEHLEPLAGDRELVPDLSDVEHGVSRGASIPHSLPGSSAERSLDRRGQRHSDRGAEARSLGRGARPLRPGRRRLLVRKMPLHVEVLSFLAENLDLAGERGDAEIAAALRAALRRYRLAQLLKEADELLMGSLLRRTRRALRGSEPRASPGKLRSRAVRGPAQRRPVRPITVRGWCSCPEDRGDADSRHSWRAALFGSRRI